jgi:hypothetical protein
VVALGKADEDLHRYRTGCSPMASGTRGRSSIVECRLCQNLPSESHFPLSDPRHSRRNAVFLLIGDKCAQSSRRLTLVKLQDGIPQRHDPISLNQRVHSSSLCAPTIAIKDLANNLSAHCFPKTRLGSAWEAAPRFCRQELSSGRSGSPADTFAPKPCASVGVRSNV